MNKRFNNKNRMFQLVAEVMETYKLNWEAIPVIVLLVAEYKALLEKIIVTAEAAGVVLKGATGSKKSTLDDLGALLYKFCSVLSLFAIRNKDMELHTKVFIPITDITGKTQGNLIIFGGEIIGLVNKHKVALLAGYPITEAQILQLTELYALAKEEMPKPEAKYTDKQTAQAELEATFAETTDFLELQLDKAMDVIGTENEKFYAAYYVARNIKNIGLRHDPPSDTNDPK